MVLITAEDYKHVKVHTITVKNRDYSWVNMKDAENGLGLKWLRGMVENKVCGIYEIKSLTKKQRKKYKRTASEIIKELKDYPQNCKDVTNDIIEKVIENCRGAKQCNDDITRIDIHIEKILDNFWVLKKMKYLKLKNIQLLNKQIKCLKDKK